MFLNSCGLYIHIPFCKSKCAYCDFFSCTNKEHLIEKYIEALCKELLFNVNLNKHFTFDTVFIGGGTPSIIPSALLQKLCSCINSLCSPKEFTIEANPDDITEEFLELLNNCKVTRLSVGIQSLNDKALKECKRRADVQTNLNSLELIKKHWKNKFSIDLITALPHETEETLIRGLQKTIEYKPDHISLYSLMLEEETPLFSTYKNYDSDKADKLWLTGREFLIKNGYNQYEVSNFCRKDNECLHNLKYWQQENYVGLGAGATGTVYKKENKAFTGLRKTNTQNIEEYINFWNSEKTDSNAIEKSHREIISLGEQNQVVETEIITEQNCRIEFFMMGLRLLKGISEEDYKMRFNEGFSSAVKDIFIKWNKQKFGEISLKNNFMNFSLNQKGILFLNKILQEILETY